MPKSPSQNYNFLPSRYIVPLRRSPRFYTPICNDKWDANQAALRSIEQQDSSELIPVRGGDSSITKSHFIRPYDSPGARK